MISSNTVRVKRSGYGVLECSVQYYRLSSVKVDILFEQIL